MRIAYLLLAATLAFLGANAIAQESALGDGWSVEQLGTTVNTEYAERFSMISPDGLVLYFASDRPEGVGPADEDGRKPWDIYVTWRESVDEPFGAPVNLGPTVNSPYRDHSAAFSEDGHWMYFASARPEGCGGYDLYVSYREDTANHLEWGAPQHLGCQVNTQFDEACPFFITDEGSGEPLLYFVRETEPRDRANFDIYLSRLGSDMRPRGIASLVDALNSPAHDGHFEPKHGFIWSSREGGHGGSDVWVSETPQRDRWSRPVNMGSDINTRFAETMPSGTNDGTLYFPSNRPGGHGDYDIYVATRLSD